MYSHKPKTHQREIAPIRDNFQNRDIIVASFCASFRASHVAMAFALVVACGQLRNSHVCRRVHNRARVGVFCFKTVGA